MAFSMNRLVMWNAQNPLIRHLQHPSSRKRPRGVSARLKGPRPRPVRTDTLFKRTSENPILAPTHRWWESVAVLNPGVVDDARGTIHLLYRAIGRDQVSRLGYARTKDGIHLDERLPEPVFEPDLHGEFERLGVEDPRIVTFGGVHYVTYTAVSRYPESDDPQEENKPVSFPWGSREPSRVRVSLALTKDFQTFTRHGVILPEMNSKDAVLFPGKIDGRYAILHRLPPDIWISFSDDLREWDDHQTILRTRPAFWDERKLGAGPPPLRIPEGWLLLYHGSDHHNVYRAGFVLLDARDPSIVLGRSEHPVLEPQEPYEKEGLVANVVFPTGLVRRADTLLVYYGGADRVVCVARGSLKEVLGSLRA